MPTCRRRALVQLVLAGAVVTLVVPAEAAPPPPPGLGVRLLDAPTNRADDPRARVYIVDHVQPGAEFSRRVEVSNGDPTPMDVRIYPATAVIDKGGFAISAEGVDGEVPRWLTASPTSAHLAPGGTVVVTVTAVVPSDAPPGEVYGGVVAERPADTTGSGVAVGLRAAIRVYLSVGPGGEPASDFTVDTLTAARDKTGRPQVIAQVHNTGGRALDATGTLRLSQGPGGLSAGPFNATLGTTLGIGQTEPVTVPLDAALPAGPWLATLELSSGLVHRNVDATITFPTQAASTSPPVTARNVPLSRNRGIVGSVAAVLLGLVVLLLASFLLWRRRHGRYLIRA